MSMELYKDFYQKHLEDKALETLKKVTGNINLDFNSTVINEFGRSVNVGEEIKEYISVMGEDILQNLETIDNKIDEWFFEYKINPTKNINKKIDNISDLKEKLSNIEQKVTENILETDIIENSFKIPLIESFKEKINSLKQSLNNLLENLKFKKVEIEEQKTNIVLDNEMKNELLSIDTVSSKMLSNLAKDNDIRILRKIASHPNTSEATLFEVSEKTDDFKVKENLLNNPKTPTEAINKYLEDLDKDIVLKALSHENVSIKKLEKFSKADDTEIQTAILNNEKTPIKLLEDIAVKNFDNPKILDYVISHKNCHPDLKNFLENLPSKTAEVKKTSLKDKIKQAKEILNKEKVEKTKTTKEHTKAL